MSEPLTLAPAPGLRVIDPATGQPLPAEGAVVEGSGYWLRALRRGDVAQVEPGKPGRKGK